MIHRWRLVVLGVLFLFLVSMVGLVTALVETISRRRVYAMAQVEQQQGLQRR